MSTTTDARTRSRWTAIALLALLLLGALLTVLFGLRAVRSFRDFDDRRGRPPHEATGNLAPWMTIPYVAAAYDVPSEFLYDELGIDPAGNDRKSLMRLGRIYFPEDRGLIMARVLAALELYYAGSAVPTPMAVEPGEVPPPEDAPPLEQDERGGRGPDAPQPDAPQPDGPQPDGPQPDGPPDAPEEAGDAP